MSTPIEDDVGPNELDEFKNWLRSLPEGPPVSREVVAAFVYDERETDPQRRSLESENYAKVGRLVHAYRNWLLAYWEMVVAAGLADAADASPKDGSEFGELLRRLGTLGVNPRGRDNFKASRIESGAVVPHGFANALDGSQQEAGKADSGLRYRSWYRLPIAGLALAVVVTTSIYFARPRESAASGPVTLALEAESTENGTRQGVRSVKQAKLGDWLRCTVVLPSQAHCYVIVFNTDGTHTLWWPSSRRDPPKPEKVIELGGTDRSAKSSRYPLSEGAGVQAVIVVISDSPLPRYENWESGRGPPPWNALEEVRLRAPWNFDSASDIQFTQEDPLDPAVIAPSRDTAPPFFASLCDWFVKQAGVTRVVGRCFQVAPQD